MQPVPSGHHKGLRSAPGAFCRGEKFLSTVQRNQQLLTLFTEEDFDSNDSEGGEEESPQFGNPPQCQVTISIS